MNWWKVLAIVATIGFGAVVWILYTIVKGFSDGMADAFGYPRSKRWRRQ